MVGSDEENIISFVKKEYYYLKDKIIFKKFISDVKNYYISADIFVMPSYRRIWIGKY